MVGQWRANVGQTVGIDIVILCVTFTGRQNPADWQVMGLGGRWPQKSASDGCNVLRLLAVLYQR